MFVDWIFQELCLGWRFVIRLDDLVHGDRIFRCWTPCLGIYFITCSITDGHFHITTTETTSHITSASTTGRESTTNTIRPAVDFPDKRRPLERAGFHRALPARLGHDHLRESVDTRSNPSLNVVPCCFKRSH